MEQTNIPRVLIVIVGLIIIVGLALLVLEGRSSPVAESPGQEHNLDEFETLVPHEDGQNLAGGGGTGPVSTVTPMVTRSYPGTVAGTPTPNPTPLGFEDAFTHRDYTVQQGDTLSGIALFFGCTVDELAAANGVSPDAIWPGQVLIVPTAATEAGPVLKLVPDSELVYGPAAIHFDLAAFVAEQGGYLASYTEIVEGRTRTGAEIVQLVAQRYSIGPRVLLALLELEAGWVTDPNPPEETLYYPMGKYEDYLEGLFQQLSWAAAELNSGYYGWKYRGWNTIRLSDGSRAAIAPEVNAGTVAIQNYLGQVAHGEAWQELVGPDGFAAMYERFFGNPFAYSVEPLLPPDLAQPEMRLPWEEGETWYLTGGPHGGWGQGSGWAALDFAPAGEMGCQISQEWITAAAPGLVLRSGEGEVVVDLDGDGYEQSGWVLTYLHVASQDRVGAGEWVERGQRIGHASCEGGFSIATHLHFARRYNGEWIPAAGSVPMVLSGWTAQSDLREYDGSMVKGNEIRVACECSDDAYNGLVSDNTPPD
jgi:murein DD-endopeptidase MepM/ murein hydrolase activator NlpD